MGIPRVYRKSGERAIASYNYIDIVDGLGFVTFNLTNTQTSDFTNYIINNKTLIVSGTTGLISGTNWYDFKTSAFNLPRTVNGTAYLTGFVKNNSITGKVTLSVESGTETGVEGSSIATDATVYSESGTSYVLKKTFIIDDYVHKVNYEAKRDSAGVAWIKFKYFYEGDNTEDREFGESLTTSYVQKSLSNPNPNRRVSKIETYIFTSTNGQAISIKNQDVIGRTMNITRTDISSTISFGTIAANSGFLVELPLTRTLIKKDERLVLRLEKTAGTGSFVLDPTSEFTTEESLKLNAPFVLNL